ncbi:MAG: hypothetical protein K2J02_01590 [Malacoplasma sp.]|nr:hypothetical protein [Malacoplasma sp.]
MKNKKKKILFSLFSLPLLASYSTFFIDTSKSAVVEFVGDYISDYKNDIADSSISYEDSFPVAQTSITKLSDYIVAYEDNNIYPVNVNNATIGMTYDFTTLTYTTYSGLLLWSSDLTKNPLIKKYYSTMLNINNIGAYRINNFTYQKSSGLLFVLFGDKTKKNQIIFAVDIYTGKINIPNEAYLKNDQIITKVTDGCGFIFFNSANEIIVTSGGTKANVDATTKIFTYSPQNSGFTDKKLNINLPTADNDGTANNDLLIGIVPGSNGTNYGYYLYSKPNANKFNWTMGESSSENFVTSGHSSYNYYIIPLNDDLSTKNRAFRIVNNNGNLNAVFGYISNGDALPDFDNIYKRIYKLENASNSSSTYMFALIDSYWKFYDSYTLISDNGKTISVSASKGFGTVRDSSNNQQLLAQKNDFSENEKVLANSWEFTNFGYDEESNLFYFSFSGQRINTTTNQPDGYKAKMGYFQFLNSSLSLNVSDFANEASNYSLYSVGYDSYSSKNYYMGKQLDRSNPVWLSRQEDQKDYVQTPNSNITFSKLSVSSINLIQQIEENKLFKETMPESIKITDLNNLVSSLNLPIKLLKISSDNQTGTISLQVDITENNNFGDNVPNGSIQYNFLININNYSIEKDFIFKFITTDMVNMGFNDKINKINEIKESTSPSNISKTQIINYFLDANIVDKNNNLVKIEDSWITLNPNNELGYLVVEASLPTDLFPIGFPKEYLSITAIYKDFWVHVNPLPPDSNPSDSNSNTNSSTFISKKDGEKIGSISGGVIAITLVFTVMFIFLYLKNRNQINKLNKELTI